MCGIAGIVVGGRDRVDPLALRTMSETLRHRGPDDNGYLLWSPGCPAITGRRADLGDGRVGLAHRRLSILDLSALGWQPMSSSDGRYYIVYNGEVYNYVELRMQLEKAGHRFVSRSDTEVMLAAASHWGIDAAIRSFEGMYAFALLDTRDATLTLARDPFGIKPLYYIANDRQFAFASEIKALLDLQGTDRRVNPKSLLAYLTVGRSDHGDETMFAQVRQVPPAGLLTLDVADMPRVVREIRTWAPSPGATLDVSRAEAARMLRDTFFGSVERHLRSDVPIGTALSGGLDSSAIITSMRRVAPDIELHAFSYFAEEPSINEERWVRAAAAASGAIVHEVTVSPTALPQDIDTLIRNQDEPFGSTSIYAQYNVFRAASAAGIHVMLDGQGADELLGGYGSFVAPHVASLLFRSRLASAGRLLLSARGRADVDLRAIARYVVAASLPRAVKARLSKRYAASGMPSWIRAAWFADRLPSLKVEQADPGPDLRAHLARETQTSLLALLRYEDRNSMAFSVESRVPFLTTRFAELALALPAEYLIAPDGTRKAVLRDAMRGVVPDVILDRRDKIGFQTPERAIITGAGKWMWEVLSGETGETMPCLDVAAIRNRVREGQNGHGPAVPLWRVLNLIRWAELFGVRFA
jgi:asparagine synthase (glutamine-hydrolysing)